MKSPIILTALFIFILGGCTPTVKDAGKSLPDYIKSEMSVVQDEKPKEDKAAEDIRHEVGKTVRIGILDGVGSVMFSFSGYYSVMSGGKTIFSKKKSSSSWKVYPRDGKVVIEDITTNEVIEALGNVVFSPVQLSSQARIGKMLSANGFYWENTKSKNYKGSVEFINDRSNLVVVNEVGVEQYLYGVVPSEMSPGSPIEALKAQAILARTNIYSNVGKKYKDRPYSLSNDIYSQVYTGIDNISDRTNKAVDDTRGMILAYKGKPAEALFHSTCGGYLDGNDVIWGSVRLPYLQPKRCSHGHADKFGGLTIEANFKKWIDARPDSYCNMDGKTIDPSLNFAKKNYRWERTVDAAQIEELVRSYTKKSIGRIKDVTVVSRGESGKAKAVKVTGSEGSHIINYELNIRKYLAKPPLFSGNIYIIKKGTDKSGYPKEFVIKGAGYGHGTGMCQIGAVGMATEGRSFREIIQFYFPGTDLLELDK
jgi:stage II sporulation protein D